MTDANGQLERELKIQRWIEESDKFRAEQRKLMAEADKFGVEQRKLMSESLKYDRDRWTGPILAIAAALGALTGLVAIIGKFILER